MAERLQVANQNAVTRHESEIKEIRRGFESISLEFGEFQKTVSAAIEELRKVVSGIGRTDTKTIISILAVMFAGFGVTLTTITIVGGLVLSPVVETLKGHTEAIVNLNTRADNNRVLILRSHDALRGAAVEQETQIGFVEDMIALRVEALYLQINTERIANGEPPLPMPNFGREIVHRADIPGLFEN